MKRRPQVIHLDPLPQGVLLFTKAQIAAAMQVSLRCLTGMMNRGEISYLKNNGRIVRFRPEDALRRLNEKTLVCNDTTAEGGARTRNARARSASASLQRFCASTDSTRDAAFNFQVARTVPTW